MNKCLLYIILLVSSCTGGNKQNNSNSPSVDAHVEDTVRYVTIYYEIPEIVERFIGHGPNEFKLRMKNYTPDEFDVMLNACGVLLVSDSASIRELVHYAKRGKTIGRPNREPMISKSPIADIPLPKEGFKDYDGLDTYFVVEFVFNNRVESIALGNRKSKGCYYLEEELLSDDIGLYDYLRSHFDALRYPF